MHIPAGCSEARTKEPVSIPFPSSAVGSTLCLTLSLSDRSDHNIELLESRMQSMERLLAAVPSFTFADTAVSAFDHHLGLAQEAGTPNPHAWASPVPNDDSGVSSWGGETDGNGAVGTESDDRETESRHLRHKAPHHHPHSHHNQQPHHHGLLNLPGPTGTSPYPPSPSSGHNLPPLNAASLALNSASHPNPTVRSLMGNATGDQHLRRSTLNNSLAPASDSQEENGMNEGEQSIDPDRDPAYNLAHPPTTTNGSP